MIAKAVANSLAKKVAAATGDEKGRSYFINIKGPELLNKYVGETERQIRLVFQRAREKSEEGWPVIVFFDEMDSMFRTRGSGISSDMESTIVPQLLAEIDGVEGLRNVIVIGATNREDLIDPAILRPGRLDVKIKIERPNAPAAAQIFARYLTDEIPIAEPAQAKVRDMIEPRSRRCTATTSSNRFLEVTYQNGDKEILYYKDFSSGAMIENIVRRAKKLAIKRVINGGERGRARSTICSASIKQEYKEHEDLPEHDEPRRLGEDLAARRASASCSSGLSSTRARTTTRRVAGRSSGSPPASTCDPPRLFGRAARAAPRRTNVQNRRRSPGSAPSLRRPIVERTPAAVRSRRPSSAP